jgi:hypothetical protein
MLSLTKKIVALFFVLMCIPSLKAQAVIVSPEEQSVHQLHRIPVIVSGKPGAEVSLFGNDSLLAKAAIRIDGLLDFLNVDVPSGPVELRIESKLGNGRILQDFRHVHILGPPAQLTLPNADLEQPADGTTIKTYRFQIQDEWGYKLDNIRVAEFDVSRGEIVSEDLDSLRRGTQVKVENGVTSVDILSADKPGKATLTVTMVGLTKQLPVYYLTPHEDLIVVGTMSVSMGTNTNNALDRQGSPFGSIANQSIAGKNILTSGRAAFYAKGNIGDDYLLTASLDTDRDYIDQLFEDVDPNDQYPIFGDASTLVFDAQTQSKLYAKIEKNENFLLLGDFNTAFDESDLTTYNRTFNGALGRTTLGQGNLTSFLTSTDRKMVLDEIRGEGLSGYYYLSRSNVTRFSEKVEIIIRDKYHFDEIIQRTKMTRFQNYNINYVDGTLMFKQPVASMDAAGNPIFIVTSYEYRSQQKDALIGGLRYNRSFQRDIQVSSTLIGENRGSANYYLYGVDTKIPFSSALSFNGELAGSRSPDLQSGSSIGGLAYRTALSYKPNSDIFLKAHFRQTDQDFVNSSKIGSGLESGSQRYGINGSYAVNEKSQILADFSQQNTELGTNQEKRRSMMSLNYALIMDEDNSFKAGLEDVYREAASGDSTPSREDRSSLISLEYQRKINEKLLSTAEHQQDLTGGNAIRPSNSSAGLQYQLTEKLSITGKYRLIYAEELKTQAVIGLDSRLTENTELVGKYEIGGLTGDDRNRASIGLNNHWMITPDVTFNLAYENVATADSLELPTSEHETISLSTEYLPEAPWKAAAKFEYQDNVNSFKRVTSLGADARVMDGLGVIMKWDHFEDIYKNGTQGRVERSNFQAGLAYRPVMRDEVNALAKLAWISDFNSHVSERVEQERMIASASIFWQAHEKLGVAGRLATRFVRDVEGDFFDNTSRTSLLNIRGDYRWSNDWSSLIDLRYLVMRPVNQSNFGMATELNYAVIQDMQVGLGYIFNDIEDADFSYLSISQSNFYISMHLKFDESMFEWR